MTITAATRRFPTGILVTWEDTNGAQTGYTVTVTELDFRYPSDPITRLETFTSPTETQWFDDDLDPDSDQVTYLLTGVTDAETKSVTVQLTDGYVYGAVDPLASTIRYTSLADVRSALGIPTADTGRDSRITQAIIAAETWIDQMLGRSFPDSGSVEEIAGIPERVKLAATNMSVAFFVAQSSPDAMIDAEIRRQESYQIAVALLAGLQVSWGVA